MSESRIFMQPGAMEITVESGNRLNIRPGICAELREYSDEMADWDMISPDGEIAKAAAACVCSVGQTIWAVNYQGSALLTTDLANVFALAEKFAMEAL